MRAWVEPLEATLDALSNRQLIVVSHHEPGLHDRRRQEIVLGGVAEALVTVFEQGGGPLTPPGSVRYVLRHVPLTRAEVRRGYQGYAAQVLWPLCHTILHEVRCWSRFWKMYQQANRRCVDAVLAEGAPGAVVWIHDYRLALCPRYLRQARPDLMLMYFWDIPWPAWDVFRICPQRAQLLDALLANDLVAFQHPRHARHFLECAARELGADVEASVGIVRFQGRQIDVTAFPISVDFCALEHLASSRLCERWMTRLRRYLHLEGRAVALSVDRLDYTRGILERLHAIEQFLMQWPEPRSGVVFIQKAVSNQRLTRTHRDLQGRILAEIARLNAYYGTPGWQPILYLARAMPPVATAALYRMADLCLVTPVHEGSNLTAKEFVACQVDHRGVLVLSGLAGAHAYLAGARYPLVGGPELPGRVPAVPDPSGGAGGQGSRAGGPLTLRRLVTHDAAIWGNEA